MAVLLLMLEDDADRAARFTSTLRGIAPNVVLRVWRDAHSFTREAEALLPESVLISLDHDLFPAAGEADPGDGYMAAQWLTAQPVVRPVIVHSSNCERSTRMAGAFDLAGWRHSRVLPFGDELIETDWRRTVKHILKKWSRGNPVSEP